MNNKIKKENKEETDFLISIVEKLADKLHDGNFTICRFNSHWSAMFGTPQSRVDIDNMKKGDSIQTACVELIFSGLKPELPKKNIK